MRGNAVHARMALSAAACIHAAVVHACALQAWLKACLLTVLLHGIRSCWLLGLQMSSLQSRAGTLRGLQASAEARCRDAEHVVQYDRDVRVPWCMCMRARMYACIHVCMHALVALLHSYGRPLVPGGGRHPLFPLSPLCGLHCDEPEWQARKEPPLGACSRAGGP